jgi:hypothetical protein
LLLWKLRGKTKMSTQTQAQSRLSPKGYQVMIDRLKEREGSGLFGSRREPSREGNYLSSEGYDRMIARVSSRQSGLAESVSTGYNGVRAVVADTGKVIGAVYNGGARVVKGLAVGTANVIGTLWNTGVGVHKYVREVRSARANARRTQEMHDTQVMALMAQIIQTMNPQQQPQQGPQPNVNYHVYSNMPNGFGVGFPGQAPQPGPVTPNAAAYNAAAAPYRRPQPGQPGQGARNP